MTAVLLLACYVIAAAACDASVNGAALPTPDRNTEPTDPTVVTIVLPHEEPTFPNGPGRRQFLSSCVVCHSPRYISMQPHFSRQVWAAEVHKMVTAYGAHVTAAEEAEIVNYIVTIRGADASGQSKRAVLGAGG